MKPEITFPECICPYLLKPGGGFEHQSRLKPPGMDTKEIRVERPMNEARVETMLRCAHNRDRREVGTRRFNVSLKGEEEPCAWS